MPPDDQPRTLKAMLSEAKDTSELMVDLAYAALFFGDAQMADEVHELEERLSDLAHAMREVCVLAARSPRDAEEMSSVDRKSTRLNSSHAITSRMPSSA